MKMPRSEDAPWLSSTSSRSPFTSRRFAFAIAVLLHVLFFYVLSKQHGHMARSQYDKPPLTVSFLPFFMPQKETPKPVEERHRENEAVPASNNHAPKAARAPQPITAPTMPLTTAPDTVSKTAESPTTTITPEGASLAQQALNAVGKMDRDERGGAGKGLGLPAESGTLDSRLAAAIDKHGAYRAGVIEEHVYPDGRREERVHTLLGDYCITYESPSDPKDGFDIMQRGYKRSVPHTCGHRFD